MDRFLELDPEYCDRETARFHIVPIPYEGTVCFQKGTARGPEAILEVSDQIEHMDEEFQIEYFKEGIATWPYLPPQFSPEAEINLIEQEIGARDLFRPDRFPIFLGGEHSITPPLVRVAAQKYPNLSVLQFDAHSDLRNEFEPGGIWSHACAMRRVLETTPHLVQVGIRSFSEEDPVACPDRVKKFITPNMIEDDFAGSLAAILAQLTDHVYITFDMDAFDPAIAPGVGTPEPGGLTWRQCTRILRAVFESGKTVVGADVMETMPLNNGKGTEYVAARLVEKIITYATAKSANRRIS
ncbi:MAG: agmatinase [Planctomycetia bacterium]|nr:agmatinase [Planctomycetia bacterium]